MASKDAVFGVFWKKQNVEQEQSGSEQSALLDRTEKQIQEYLDGKRKEFDLPIRLEGTNFQKRVWQELALIPYGKTCSYKDLAKKLNDGNASRAVGTANGKNPMSLIIPCHRVITSSGSLGGYAGGLAAKEILLSLEANAG